MKILWIRILFVIAALYDGILGGVFLVAPTYPFHRFEVTLPNHLAYVQFPAALLLIFAIMFCVVAVAPRRNRQLVVYGFLLKVSYCGVAFWYWFTSGIPGLWKPFAVIDLVMAALFLSAYAALKPTSSKV